MFVNMIIITWLVVLEVSELPLLAPPLLLDPLGVVARLLLADHGGHDGVRHVANLQQQRGCKI